MSDYSPPESPDAFDDLQDILYDADPAPDLADELASHALHSPLLYAQDYDPGYELTEYFSDWEYYSDDYYDDDPDILRVNPIDGDPPMGKKRKDASTKTPSNEKVSRGKKRKAADADLESEPQLPPMARERRFLAQCMQGTVWATPAPIRDNVYRVGQGEKVALLKDWREKFGNASPRKTLGGVKKTPRLPEDEGWANDLSLADMGLMNERGKGMAGGDAGDDGEDGEEDRTDQGNSAEGEQDGDIDLDDLEIDEEAYELLKAAAETAARDGSLDFSKLNLPPQQVAALQAALTHRSRTTSPEQEQEKQQQMQPPPLPTPAASQPTSSKRRKKNTPSFNPAGAQLSVEPEPQPQPQPPAIAEEQPTSTDKPAPNTRKRKASSPLPDEEAEATASKTDQNSRSKTAESKIPRPAPKKAANGANKRVASVANNVKSTATTAEGDDNAAGGGGRVTRSSKRKR